MPTSRSRAGIDAWTSDATPALNTGQGKWLRVQAGSPVKHSWWKAKNPAPRGATVLVAELRFFGVGSTGGSFTANVQRADSGWAESLINANNEPGVTGAAASLTQNQNVDGLEWAFNVQPQLQTVCDGAAYYGFRLATTDTTEHKFYSSDSLDYQPYLYVEWADVPDAPTELSPSGGSAVSVNKPTLLFNFHDPVGSDMAALQVQINTTSSMGSPAFDSGTVASTDPEYDTSTGSFGGIAVAATKFWRVRVQNAAGNWSDWSDVRSFTRIAKGTLTLGSPTGAHVSDATPTVIWSLSGATQTGYQVTLWDDSDPGDPIFDTGRRSSTATSLTIPKGNVTDENVTYRLRVRTWDDLTRTATPGDTAHTEVVTTFTFVEDPTPNAPTSVTVSQATSGQPHVQLDIVRSSAPDFFGIQRNGVWIDTDVDPTDIYLSGTTYRYIDRTAPPNRNWTYKVRSKVAGVQGPARTGSPDPFRYTVAEVWLLDWTNPGSNRLVPIQVDLSQCTFDMPEVGGTYTPVDGQNISTVKQSLKGLTGTITGRIVARHGLSADASVADMLWFKGHAPRNRVRLVIGAQNLEVEIRNVVLSPLATSDSDARQVSFAFNSFGGPRQ